MVLPPKQSAELIASLAKNIKIKTEGIEKLGKLLIEEIEKGNISSEKFSQCNFHPKPEDPWALQWILVADTLNFCFWSTDNKKVWTVEGYTGYFALCAALNRAMKENIDILNPLFFSIISEKDLKYILRSDNDTEIPLFQERLNCLHEVGKVLLVKFDGLFENILKKCNNSAITLLNEIIINFNCFRDETIYKGQKVSFYKRAQILVGDIWSCFNNQGIGYFNDINEITMFPDYRVPQSLLWFGVFEYKEDFFNRLLNNPYLSYGDEDEIEIRGCSIHAVELVKNYINENLKDNLINSILIDHYLWDFRRQHAKEIFLKNLPFHKTFCIFY